MEESASSFVVTILYITSVDGEVAMPFAYSRVQV